MARTKVQAFEYAEIPRTAITDAPYNPRVMSEQARRKLRGVLRRHGLVETLVWNRRTGHLVGGHRRLEELDAASGGQAYSLGVAAIDVDAQREREINVALNNVQAQGAFDPKKFFALVDAGADLEGMGLTKADLEIDFGSIAQLGEPFAAAARTTDTIVQDLTEIRAARKAHIAAQEAHPKNDAEYFLMVQFPTAAARDAVLAQLAIIVSGVGRDVVVNADDIRWRADIQAKYDAARNPA
jgi:hypothetical protein